MGSDFFHLAISRHSAYVSIHAPTWGATILTVNEVNVVEVSIHAHTWGAT